MTSSLDFAALFDRHYPKLYAYVRSRLPDDQTAEDITAAAFERALRHTQSYDSTKGAFSTWLFRIARNLVVDHYATASRLPVQSDLDEVATLSVPTPSPEDQLLRQEQQRALGRAISHLPDRDQEIIRLRFFGRLTNRRIAAVMDLKEKTVSVIIYRALLKLKAQLEVRETL
jgi:RNA polymerase sigma factor (sigma-70 family)